MGKKKRANGNGKELAFEQKLFALADKMRGQMDAAEYKHVVLGLIFLKYISDSFEELYKKIENTPEKDPENYINYLEKNIFWVPKPARWSYLETKIGKHNIGKSIDIAMNSIEKENPSLKGFLPKNYGRSTLDQNRLEELINLIGSIGLGDDQNRSKDILGRVYEYFLGRFASTEGKGGEFYTPQSVVKLLVEMVQPYKGIVYDPCCGSGGMFVQSEKFVKAHGGTAADLFVYGQESNPTTWRLCKMNLAIRGIKSDIGCQHADTFHNDLHKVLQADFIIANPPFNDSDWGGEKLLEDARWKYGIPPKTNANFAWVEHIVHHLCPTGIAGFVLSNGSLSSNQKIEKKIRESIIEADLIDCIVALPNQLFYTTQIAACVWFIAKNKTDAKFRSRQGETLFIYAYNAGQMIDRTHCELSENDIDKISNTYHNWHDKNGNYKDVLGFCKSTNLAEIESHKMSLVPGRYVGFNEILSEQWNIFNYETEMLEITERLSEVNETSKAALAVIRELLNG